MRVFSALLSVVALLPLVTRAAFHSNNTACTRHYTVQAGDTCDKIGQKTLTSTYQILAFNLLDAGADCYTLEIGTKLCLGRYGNDCQFVHQCTDQDTCESIANAYGITTQRLQSNNPSLDCDIVYDGLMLCVSAGSIRPPADSSLNATDAKVAREQARQAWLAQQPVQAPQPASRQKSKSHHTHSPTSNKHTSHSPHHHHHQQHHKHASNGGGKQIHESHSHQAAAAPTTHQAPQQQSRAVNLERSSSLTVERSSSSQSTDDLFIDDLLTKAPLGSNHTPNLPEQVTLYKRHRSLSSRSHHQQRSHTP
ncbi:hypothetical protein EX895_004945 [Sporisorium graminicola]|uniref:LysM domain-containing protein n=1 Tax=Sporisorium graminicola TaxID=280036 RepID=A0A4U7KP27_9BASI|nr:hypothetical protein EX895_004945 [Sporisorium graminicola]TKY86120.1 hypothetical protein EX895_004945 [Sporisorium graminicola]